MEDIIQQALLSEEAMTSLLKDLEPFVFRLSYHLTRHQQDAEDLAQDVLYKICTKLSKFHGSSSLQTWVYTMVMNCYRDGLRRRKIRSFEPMEKVDDQASARSFESHTDAKLLVSDLLRDLPEVDRNILILRFQNDLSVKEVAGIMKMSEANVKTRVFRLRERLRQLIPQGGEVL